jgi:predicted ATPase
VAAENAARIFAHNEAMALATRGLALIPALPDTPERTRRELALQVILAMQLQIAQGFAAPEAERIYARAHLLYEQIQETPRLFPVLWGLWMFYEVRGKLAESRQLAERLYTLAEGAEDRGQLLQARQALTITSLCLGDPAAARQHMDHGVVLYDPRRHRSHAYLYGQDPIVGCLAFGAVALWLLGYPDQAVERSQEAVSVARESGQPSSVALAQYFAAILRQYRREGPAVERCAAATTALATEHGYTFWRANGLAIAGWAQAERGAWADGIAQLRQGLTAVAATGAGTYRTYTLSLLADALGRAGQVEEGLGVLAEALALINSTGEGFHGAELHRLQGEFLLRQASSESARHAAEACFRRALTLARGQQARSLELRAAMSLTRLFQEQDRRAEARPVLARCYDWFTEGFDTPDLLEARALLEQVS